MSTIRIHAHLCEDLGGIAGGEFLDTIGEDVTPDGDVEAAALRRATDAAREADEEIGDEVDWTSWVVKVVDQNRNKIAEYDLESLLERETA